MIDSTETVNKQKENRKFNQFIERRKEKNRKKERNEIAVIATATGVLI